jgi:hypothetical protein
MKKQRLPKKGLRKVHIDPKKVGDKIQAYAIEFDGKAEILEQELQESIIRAFGKREGKEGREKTFSYTTVSNDKVVVSYCYERREITVKNLENNYERLFEGGVHLHVSFQVCKLEMKDETTFDFIIKYLEQFEEE